MASARLGIIAAFKTRLEAIRADDGFNTDAGLAVVAGEVPTLGPDDPDVAIAVLVGDDEPKAQGNALFIRLPIELAAVAKATLDAPWVAVEAVLEDIKRAMELQDRTLGGLAVSNIERGSTRTLPRESGSTTVGAAMTYFCSYKEAWGNP